MVERSVGAVAAALLLLPALALAAYNDVTLTTSAIISVDSTSLNVSGSSATIQSITVGAASFDVTLLPGSSVTFSAASKKILVPNVSYSNYVVAGCSSTGSTLALTANPSESSATINVHISAALCDAAPESSSTAVSGAGGGPVGSYGSVNTSTTAAATTATTPAATTPVAPAAAPAAVSAVTFSRYLSLGSRGDDVTSLQTLLESKGFLTMPEGATKGYFGGLTKSALSAYQKSVGIDPLGVVGPATRAALNSAQ